MKRFLVVAGGELSDTFACRVIEETAPEVMIAADRGMDFFYRLRKNPDVIIGDFDSARSQSLTYFREQGVQIKELSPMKDDTDTEAALRLAVSMGAERYHAAWSDGKPSRSYAGECWTAWDRTCRRCADCDDEREEQASYDRLWDYHKKI